MKPNPEIQRTTKCALLLVVGETVVLLTPPSPSLSKHLLKGVGGERNGSLADG